MTAAPFYSLFMRLQFFFSITLLLVLPFCLQPAQGAAEQPSVTEVRLVASQENLLISTAVQDCFTKEMLEGVHNAIPVTFRFYLDLRRMRDYWFDERLARQVINHTLRYDPIKQEYQVAFSEKEEPETTRSLAEAEKMMAELHDIRLLQLNKLRSGEKYALHIKATLAENTLPLSIHSIIPFFSLWNFETDWRTVKFRY